MMDSGAYRNKVLFQKIHANHDLLGVKKDIWNDFKTAYAYVNGLAGREFWEAATVQQENTVEFAFRWKPFFDTMNAKQYRIVFRNRIYNITSIDNIQFRNRIVKIRAVTKDDTNDSRG